MSDLLTWAPLITAGAVIWAGHGVMQVIHAANLDRREDHRELMDALENIGRDMRSLELMAGDLFHRSDRPDLSEYD